VPEDGSEELRRFVEALFITHAETKLNVFGRLAGTYMDTLDDGLSSNRMKPWCQGLIGRPLPRTTGFSTAPATSI